MSQGWGFSQGNNVQNAQLNTKQKVDKKKEAFW
jgi:hypothetical protein